MDFAERLPLAGTMLSRMERRFYLRHVRAVRADAGRHAFKATDGTVAKGLFAGMKIDQRLSWGDDLYSTIGGQYERELQPILARAFALDYRRFVDIGCANGYYAIGAARAMRGADVFAFDIDAEARRATERNARLNDVADRVRVEGAADYAILGERLRGDGSAFLLSDIEGAELDLLDPARCPALLDADLLIELHGDMTAAIAEFARRFGAGHSLHVVSRSWRSPFEDDHAAFAIEDDAWIAVSEGRGFVRRNWLFAIRTAVRDRYADVLDAPHIHPASD